MADRLNSPIFSTSVGLLRWANLMNEIVPQGEQRRRQPLSGGTEKWDKMKDLIKRLLP
jgi:hypothetical protein